MPYAIEPLNALFGALLQKFWISDAYAKYLVIFCHNVKMLDPFTGTLVKKFTKGPCKLVIMLRVWFKTYD